MKVYHSLDFVSARKRIEPNIVDQYSVHAEDFENINDLIRRSIRTRTKFHEDKVDGLEYDFEIKDDTLNADQQKIDLSVQKEVPTAQVSVDAEQSKGETKTIADGNDFAPTL